MQESLLGCASEESSKNGTSYGETIMPSGKYSTNEIFDEI
jgi:hypothetical protein